ncbi:MAG: asparagine synthase (glutamine-hydrolyzing) [Pseudomonadota bacterium]
MCGIAGIASSAPLQDRESLSSMRDTMTHRGPDDAGIWWSQDACVGLAHRRLSIIDLSSGGHQPMLDGALTIVFNGEIYNYRELKDELRAMGHTFRTKSDTEVLLESYKAWGTQCLSRLEGMFAFCIYDSREKQLFLARDRAGEKPLFYQHNNDQLVFASELKGLLSIPGFSRKLDLEGLNFYLAYGYIPGEMCLVKGVHKLPQGHCMTYRSGKIHIWRYWQLPELATISHDQEALTGELENLLEDSVRRQLIADVPVGVLLSGGLDSSLITAMAAQATSRAIKTFTVSFAGHAEYDEAPYAKIVADYFGTEHLALVAEPAAVDILPKLARQFDEPIADHAIVPTYLVSQLIREHATVALSGDGGDELFGGYPHYSWIQRQIRLRRIIPNFLRSSIGYLASYMLPVGMRGRNHLIGFGGGVQRGISYINLYFDKVSRERLLSPAIINSSPETYKERLCVPAHSPAQQAMAVDFQTTLVDAYLVKVDRASMLASLEIRAPFLSYPLIEFAFKRVPDSLRATQSERKILLRHLARKHLPHNLDIKRKQGFTMPIASWFKTDWGDFIKSTLRDAELFDQSMIQRLIKNQSQGYSNANRLFALTMFELWRREYNIDLPH